MGFLLLLKLAKTNLGLKGYEGSRQGLKQKSPEGKLLTGMLKCSYTIQDPLPGSDIHNGLGPPTPIISQNTPQACYLAKIFSIEVQVDKTLASTRNVTKW